MGDLEGSKSGEWFEGFFYLTMQIYMITGLLFLYFFKNETFQYKPT